VAAVEVTEPHGAVWDVDGDHVDAGVDVDIGVENDVGVDVVAWGFVDDVVDDDFFDVSGLDGFIVVDEGVVERFGVGEGVLVTVGDAVFVDAIAVIVIVVRFVGDLIIGSAGVGIDGGIFGVGVRGRDAAAGGDEQESEEGGEIKPAHQRILVRGVAVDASRRPATWRDHPQMTSRRRGLFMMEAERGPLEGV